MELLGLDDNKKIGMLLLGFSFICYTFGVLLFFKRSLLLLSNVLFLFGLYFFIGITGIIKFFTKKGKIQGTIVLCLGFVLLLIDLSFLGGLCQLIGFFIIFRSFLPDFYDSLCKLPYAGKYLKSYWLQSVLDRASGNA